MRPTFLDALLSAPRPVVAEVKRRDARGADLLGSRPVAEVLAGYEAAGAPCISVVTGRWFGGSVDLLRDVARRTPLPLLQKDFITKRSQLEDARVLGASAVLLTATLLPKVVLHRLVERSLSVGLTPFVEVTSEPEIDGLPHAEECVVAVNNKDIRNRERGQACIDRSLVLLPAVRAGGTRCPVSASGIDTPDVAARLLDAGFAGLLVGSALLRSGNPQAWFDDVDGWRGAVAAAP